MASKTLSDLPNVDIELDDEDAKAVVDIVTESVTKI